MPPESRLQLVRYLIGDGWVEFYAEPLVTLVNGEQTLSLHGRHCTGCIYGSYGLSGVSDSAAHRTRAAIVMAVRLVHRLIDYRGANKRKC